MYNQRQTYYQQGPADLMPYQIAQQRIQSRMQQDQYVQQPQMQYPQYQMQSVPQMQNMIKAIPVTSFDEAKAAIIDYDGSLFVFTNIKNGEIYTKQLNLNTGNADLNVYALVTEQNENGVEYITKAEFADVQNNIVKLKEEIDLLKGGLVNVSKSNADNATIRAAKK